MLGISRWTEAGGSYRTVQRFYTKTLPWAAITWLFVRHHLLQTDHEYVLAVTDHASDLMIPTQPAPSRPRPDLPQP